MTDDRCDCHIPELEGAGVHSPGCAALRDETGAGTASDPSAHRQIMREAMQDHTHPTRSSTFTRSDLEVAAETFVLSALDSLDLTWEPDEIDHEVQALVSRAFSWRD